MHLESATPMALFPTNHTLTQGSLHYRLATLGYQKRNTYGVETFIPLRDLYHFASQFASFYLVFCIILSHDLRQIITAIHANNEMMDFTPQNKGKMDCNPSLNKPNKQYAHNTPYSELNYNLPLNKSNKQ